MVTWLGMWRTRVSLGPRLQILAKVFNQEYHIVYNIAGVSNSQ